MPQVKFVQIQEDDGSLSSNIPFSVEAANVILSSGKTLQQEQEDFEDQIQDAVDGKLTAPETAGTSGQVLRLGSGGDPEWASVAQPTDAQVGTAVNTWLIAHPEATTTVQDGAISYVKLDSSLKGSVDDVAELKSDLDAYCYETTPANITGWVQGWIRDNGTFESSTTDCRTGYVSFDFAGETTLTVANGYKFDLFEYATSSGSLVQKLFRARTEPYTFTATNGHYYAMQIQNAAGSTLAPSELPDDAVSYTTKYTTDSTLTRMGKPADAKATGDAVSSLKIYDGLLSAASQITWSQGYWAIANGYPSSTASDWMRTQKYIQSNISYLKSTNDIILYLQAWDSANGNTYIGTWNGSAFTKTYIKYSGLKVLDLDAFRTAYPTYVYTISAIAVTSRTLNAGTDGATIVEFRDKFNPIRDKFNLIDAVINSNGLITVSQGAYKIVNGDEVVYNDWMKINKYISENVNYFLSTSDILMYLQAWNKSDNTYIGTWNGSAFSTTYSANTGVKLLDLASFRKTYPGYKFSVSMVTPTGRTLTPATDGETILCYANIKDLIDTTVSIDKDFFMLSINHRGYSAEAPENTIPAYILSKKKGFDYAECDVEFTAPDETNTIGVAVLLHDSTINRTARNADGTELSETIAISSITYAQALEYDFGIWKGSQFAGTKIPTFEQFIIACKKLSLHPVIELKDAVGGTYWTDARIAYIASVINKYGMADKVLFISFAKSALEKIMVYFPKAMIGLGLEGSYSEENFSNFVSNAQSLLSDSHIVAATVSYTSMTDALYTQLTSAGIRPIAWTVNSENAVINLNSQVIGVLSDSVNAGKILVENMFLQV